MIKNLSPIVIAIFLFFTGLYSEPDVYWAKTFGGLRDDCGYSVIEAWDGGYIIGGSTSSFSEDSSSDVYLMKTDSLGNTLWRGIYGGPDWEPYYSKDYGYSVAETKDRGIVIVGCTFPYGGSNSSVYLVKVNRKGNYLWEKTYGGPMCDAGNCVIPTEDGGCVIAGWSDSVYSNGVGRMRRVYVIKTDRDGDTLWTKKYGRIAISCFQEGHSIRETRDHGFIIAGELKIGTDWDAPKPSTVYLIKTDSLGDTVWTKTYTRSTGDYGFSVLETEDGGYIVAGGTLSDQNKSEVYLMKTDSMGNFIGHKFYGGPADGCGYSVAPANDGGFLVAGRTNSFGAGLYDMYLLRTDSLGDTLWTKTVGGTGWDEGHSVIETKDGGYLVAGWTKSFGLGGADIYLVKLDPEVGVKEGPAAKSLVSRERLDDNFPNPFSKETIIKCRIEPGKGFGSLKIYNCAGQAVKSFVVQPGAAGMWIGRWDGIDDRCRPVPAGVYFYQLETGNSKITKSMIRLSNGTASYHKGGNDE
jgi:hypothetical protein